MYELMYTFRTHQEFSELRISIQQKLQSILGVNCSFFMEVAVNEAVNNALEANTKNEPITFYIRVTDSNRLIIRIKDQGNGFNANDSLNKIMNSTDLFFEERLFEESGRGLSLMKYATDKVIYNRKGNEILLMKYIQNNQNEVSNFEKDEVLQ